MTYLISHDPCNNRIFNVDIHNSQILFCIDEDVLLEILNTWTCDSPSARLPLEIVTDPLATMLFNLNTDFFNICAQRWKLHFQECPFFGIARSEIEKVGIFSNFDKAFIISVISKYHSAGKDSSKRHPTNLLSLLRVIQNSSRFTNVSRFGKSELEKRIFF